MGRRVVSMSAYPPSDSYRTASCLVRMAEGEEKSRSIFRTP